MKSSKDYHSVPTDENSEVDDVTGRICVSPETASSDMDNDDTEEPGSSAITEKQLLLPSEKVLEKAMAKRKAQLVKIGIISVVCMLQVIAVPVFFGEVDAFWDGMPSIMTNTAKYSLLGTYIISTLFAPMLISLLGIKIIFVIGCFFTCFFVGCNFLPLEYSVMPASILSGLLLGPFFTAQGVFLTNCVFRYCATLTTCDPDAILYILNGLFYTIFFLGPVILDGTKLILLNLQYIPIGEIGTGTNRTSALVCGANFCPPVRTKDFHELHVSPAPENFTFTYHRIQAILGVYFLCAISAFIICAVLFKSNHPLLVRLRTTRCCSPSPQYRSSSFKKANGIELVSITEHLRVSLDRWKDTFMSYADVNICLIIPLFLYLGLQQGLFYMVFSKDIVECRLGRGHVYLLRILAALCSSLSAFPVSLLARYLGRVRLALPTACVQFSLLLTMSLWQPGLDEWGVLYVIAALWGCTDSLWHVMTSAMVGRLFRGNKEVAFAQYRMWQMVGILITDILREFLCTKVVLYIFAGALILMLVPYISFEIRVRLQIKEQLSRNGNTLTDVTLNIDHEATWMPTLDPHSMRRQRAMLASKLPPSMPPDSWN